MRAKKNQVSKKKTSQQDHEKVTPDERFPIVGIGASAGGLAAFEAFFSGMPPDTDPGMAFVLVQHLAPDHKSILAELVRRYTRMQVFEVEDGMIVKPNCAYIIPPNCDMAFLNGVLQLMKPVEPRGRRLPIDYFFRSLAQDQRDRAICIVLSGTGSDGTLGIRDIKGSGGMVMVQSPDTTEYDGMPRSALGTGLVDYELPPEKMARQLIAYVTKAFDKTSSPAPPPKTQSALNKLFILLRNQTGHDFSQYKSSTIHRRMDRRMAVNQIDTLDAYTDYVQKNPMEVQSLFRDLLIGVTSFFRDPKDFKVLEDCAITKLCEEKQRGETIRVWVPGCSTGEEAYSIAILLQEQMERLKMRFKIQIFATDIDEGAIATARTGIYSGSIASDISSERLARFFTEEPHGHAYQVHKSIRDLLIFSEQDVIKPAATRIINLIASDVGRPVGHIVSNLIGYNNLVADVQSVLNTLTSIKTEVQSNDSKWYTMNIQPYRTLNNVIEGAVITFVDITEMRQTREELRKTTELLKSAGIAHQNEVEKNHAVPTEGMINHHEKS